MRAAHFAYNILNFSCRFSICSILFCRTKKEFNVSKCYYYTVYTFKFLLHVHTHTQQNHFSQWVRDYRPGGGGNKLELALKTAKNSAGPLTPRQVGPSNK